MARSGLRGETQTQNVRVTKTPSVADASYAEIAVARREGGIGSVPGGLAHAGRRYRRVCRVPAVVGGI